VYTESTVYLP